MKRVLGMGSVIAVILLIIIIELIPNDRTFVVVDLDNTIIGEVKYESDSVSYSCEKYYDTYIQLATVEAAEIVMEKEALSFDEAIKYMAENEMSIVTTLDSDMQKKIYSVSKDLSELCGNNYAISICDNNSKLLCAVSYDVKQLNNNYVSTPHYAASTIKPLSVYGPAIQNDVINYSSTYLDDGIEQRTDEDGKSYLWPSNTREYSKNMICVSEALKYSNNAVALRVLKNYGINNSLNFLKNTLEYNVEYEEAQIKKEGENAVLGNIGLGYLGNGVTQLQLLEGYNSIANEGKTQKVYTVDIIIQNGVGDYYIHDDTFRTVFDSDTAYILNRLLREVVKGDGTGASAWVEGLDVCGKTGTSEGFEDNIFIGVTPKLVCGVWYSPIEAGGVERNEAPTVFSKIMNSLEIQKGLHFKEPSDVIEKEYCLKSGLIANDNCSRVSIGYYKKNNIPQSCNCQ